MSSLAQHGRNVPKFEDTTKTDTKVSTDAEVNTDSNENTVDSIVDAIVNAPKEKAKKQVSIYLDEDVARAFDRFGKKNGKGAKSNLVNTFLRKALDM